MKVLVVEDEKFLLEDVQADLEEHKFTVDTAMDGETALSKARKNNYDVILLDLKLPKMSGFQVLSGLRMVGVKTPVLVMSAIKSTDDKVRVLDMGADDYIVKNFDNRELIARTKAMMRRGTTVKRNILKCQDVIINLSNMTVSRRGKNISLTKTELGILVELFRKKGDVVSREHLLENVWGEKEGRVRSNSVDVHMKTLRQKVEKKNTEKPLIETVRGYGYRVMDK